MWRIGEILVRKKLVTWEDLEEALKEQQRNREFIGEILVRKGHVSRSLLYKALADQFHMKFVDLTVTRINTEAVRLVPESIAKKYGILPIEVHDGKLIMGVSDPLKSWPEEEIRKMSKVNAIQKVLCLNSDIQEALREQYRLSGTP